MNPTTNDLAREAVKLGRRLLPLQREYTKIVDTLVELFAHEIALTLQVKYNTDDLTPTTDAIRIIALHKANSLLAFYQKTIAEDRHENEQRTDGERIPPQNRA